MNNLEFHKPVLINEVLKYLDPKENDVILDCTFGAGGWTRRILESSNCKVLGIDRDESVKCFAEEVKKQYENRFNFYNIKYSEIASFIDKVDGIVLDLGVSSMQLDNVNRGFSFQKNFRLDMRMGKNSFSAYEVINNYTEKELADIIYNNSDEVKAREIAREIVKRREISPIETTFELADIIKKVYKNKKTKINPATKTFQAIRIEVNDELKELSNILEMSKKILNYNGRLIVVSFHSLEDAIVKDFIKKETNKSKKIDKYSNKNMNFNFELLTNKPITPTEEEIQDNIRARSAKLRALKKC